MGWVKTRLRGSVVFARTRDDGALAVDPDGRVEIRYRDEEHAKVYRASAQNLDPVGSADAGRPVSAGAPRDAAGHAARPARAPASPAGAAASMSPAGAAATTAPAAPAAASPAGPDEHAAIHVWTDGACTGNPGPMGIGVVIRDGGQRREIGEFLGRGTNNIAELTAIERALEALAGEAARSIRLHVDSSYAIGVLARGFRAKANAELIARIRRKLAGFARLRFIKVEGHAGVPENERADELARGAIARGR